MDMIQTFVYRFLGIRNFWRNFPVYYIVLCSVLLGMIMMMYCLVSDDLGYSGTYSDFIFHSKPFPGLKPWFDFFVWHAERVNGRLGDKFIAIYLAMPRWIMALNQSVCAALMFCLASRLAFGKGWRRRRRSVVITSLMVLVLPWYDCGFMACMFLNYQLALVIVMAWVLYFLYPPNATAGSVIGIALLSFCAGAWHEGFSVIVLPAVVFIQILREKRSSVSWVAFVFYLVGIAFILACPGFWRRFNIEYSPQNTSWLLLFLKASYALPLVLVCAWQALQTFVFGKTNRYTRDEWMLLGFTVALVCGSIYVSRGVDSTMFRLWWFALAFALIGWAVVFKDFILRPWLNMLVVWTFSALTVAHLSVCIYWQYRLKEEYETVMRAYLVSKDGKVYFDSHAPTQVPAFALRKPQRDIFMNYVVQSTAWIHPHGKILKLLPSELRHIETMSLSFVDGTDSIFRTPLGHIILKTDKVKVMNYGVLRYKNREGKDASSMVMAYNLNAKRDSDLVFLSPYFHTWEDPEDIAFPQTVEIWSNK